MRDEGWFVYQHHFCRSHESLPRATPAAPSRERARAVWWSVPIRVACDIFKYFEIETDPFSLFFEVSGRVRLCRLLCVVVRRIQMPTTGEIYFSRETDDRVVDSFLNNLVLTPRTGMVSVFFFSFFCVFAPKKFTRVREREFHTHTQGGTHIPYHRFDSIDRSMHKDPKKHLFSSVCGQSRRLVVETTKEG